MHHGRQIDENGRRSAQWRAGGRRAVSDDDKRRHHDDGGTFRGTHETSAGQHEHQESRDTSAQAGLTQRAAEKGTWHTSTKCKLLLFIVNSGIIVFFFFYTCLYVLGISLKKLCFLFL